MRQLAAHIRLHECVPMGAQLNVPAEWKPGVPWRWRTPPPNAADHGRT